MATETQSKYISDLAVIKTKEFKEVKELLISSGIVGENAETVSSASTIADMSHALTDMQASKFIDLLISTKTPFRDVAYSKKRIEKTVNILDDIKSTINKWSF